MLLITTCLPTVTTGALDEKAHTNRLLCLHIIIITSSKKRKEKKKKKENPTFPASPCGWHDCLPAQHIQGGPSNPRG